MGNRKTYRTPTKASHTSWIPGRRTALILASATALLAGCASTGQAPGTPELMLVANDEKVQFDDAGQTVFLPPGKDSVSVVDIGTDPLSPRIIADLPLMNSIFGPPTNLAITPDGSLGLVANPMNWMADGAKWKPVPGNDLYVIDLTANPPRLIDTVAVGKQPSGMSINRAGTLALIANRADNSISVLRIAGKKVTLIDTVAMGEQVAHVVFTPDGKRALVVKFPGNKASVLDVDGERVTNAKQDMPVGLWPYNADVTPDGTLAITANNGNAGASDGNVNTVSVIDLQAAPPRVIDKVVVGDSPEGFAISPTGRMAVAVLIEGSNSAKTAWYYHPHASVVTLKIDGKKVTKTGSVAVGRLPEGVVFSRDGRYVYVGNYMDRNVSILKVEGDRLVDTGRTLELSGQPAAMRGAVR